MPSLPTRVEIAITHQIGDARLGWDALMREVYARQWQNDAERKLVHEGILRNARHAPLEPQALAHLAIMTTYLRAYWVRHQVDYTGQTWGDEWGPLETVWLTQMEILQQDMSQIDISDMRVRSRSFESATIADMTLREPEPEVGCCRMTGTPE